MPVAQALVQWSCSSANQLPQFKDMTPSEKMYTNIETELLAIVWGAQKVSHICVRAQSFCWDRPQTVGVNLSETTEWDKKDKNTKYIT